MTNAQQGFDPFEQGDKTSAATFKEAPFGSMLTIQIDDDAKWLQTRDYRTGEPAYWDARPGETPNPKMAAVVTGIVASTPWAVQSGQAGERRSVWAEKPSNLFTAIQNAKRAAGNGTALPILAGGTLDVALTGEEPPKDPRNNPAKTYQARYTPPPAGFGQQDAFEGNQAYTPAPQQSAFAQQAAPQVAQVGTAFGQQSFQQPAAPQLGHPYGGPQQPGQPYGQPQGQPFQQAPAQPQQPAPQAPAGDPWAGRDTGFGQGSPQQQAPAAQPQQPAMAGSPAGGDPWASAPSQDVPNF